MSWTDIFGDLPLIAILRGLTPEEAEPVGEALLEAGFRCLEVPLNSPRPLESIAILQDRFGDRALVGAGTVLTPAQVEAVAGAGGRIIISPNTRPEVIRATKALGLVSLPAFQTPSEAFEALDAGADGLKLFPAEAAGPAVVKALRAVLAGDIPLFPVGGIDAGTMPAYPRGRSLRLRHRRIALCAGQDGVQEVGDRARSLAEAWRAAARVG